jgi:type I restriction enzyme, S subunit
MSDLPPGWEWATLGELCDINPRSFDHPPRDDDIVSVVPMVAVEAESGLLDASQLGEYGRLKSKSLSRFQEGDVLFAKITPCMENGKVALARRLHGGRAVGSTEFHVLRTRGCLVPEYLVRYLLQETIRADAEQEMTGAVGQRRVPRAHLETLTLPVPPVLEQQRIVAALEAHLSLLESSAATLSAVSRRLHRLRDRIIAAACNGSLFETKSLAPSSLPDSGVHDGELPPIPPTWRWVRLHEIADVVGGVTKDAKKQAGATLIEVPYLRVANVQRGHINMSNVATIRAPKDKIEQLALRPGDVLLNEGGDRDKLARGWIWEGQIPLCIHQNHVFRARVRGDALDPKILAWHANSFGKSWAMANGRQSVNLASISLSKIRLLPVPLPPKSDQRRIISMVEEQLHAIDRLIDSLVKIERRASLLRREILVQAFSGRLVSQEPTDESAGVLLERIRVEWETQPNRRRARQVENSTQEILL